MFNLRCCAIASTLVTTLLIDAPVLSPAWAQSASRRPAPPRGLPPNRAQPGGGLDEALQACEATDQALTAVIPVASPVLTTQTYPTFLIYIPDTAESISTGEFSLLTADEKVRIYSTEIDIEDTPGIISISIPESEEYALQTEEIYHWYFKLDCLSTQANESSNFDLFIDGWIQRVDATSEREQAIVTGTPDIWHDVIAMTAEKLKADPENPELQSLWRDLLATVNLENLSTAEILGTISTSAAEPLESAAD